MISVSSPKDNTMNPRQSIIQQEIAAKVKMNMDLIEDETDSESDESE